MVVTLSRRFAVTTFHQPCNAWSRECDARHLDERRATRLSPTLHVPFTTLPEQLAPVAECSIVESDDLLKGFWCAQLCGDSHRQDAVRLATNSPIAEVHIWLADVVQVGQGNQRPVLGQAPVVRIDERQDLLLDMPTDCPLWMARTRITPDCGTCPLPRRANPLNV